MSDLRIETCVLGAVSTNCYIIYQKGKGSAVIVDPADNGAYLLNRCRELGTEPEAILLTHGHFDHILAVDDIRRAFPQCRLYAGAAEEGMLREPHLNLTGSWGASPMSLKADQLLEDGETFSLLDETWRVIATPGHTSGSICYYLPAEDVLFAGDTLFYESLGRTDLPTGNTRQILASITEKLFALPEDTMVYTGHGDPTTIGHEMRYNPAAPYWKR